MIEDVRNVHFKHGGGVTEYRRFLQHTEGIADAVRLRLERREQFFAEFEQNRPHACYQPDIELFRRSMFRRRADTGLSPEMLWLTATAKLNQAERFGVGLGELFGKDQDKFETQPERLYVQLQEHYHTRILAEVLSMFGLALPTVPPSPGLRTMIALFVALPHEWTLSFVCASEIVGCVLFRAMRDRGVILFADDPVVAHRIRLLYNEILADEIGHVGFLAAKLSSRGRRIARWLARTLIARNIVGGTPELTLLFGREEIGRLVRSRFDVLQQAEEFPGRAYAAAAI
jgi:hypothetical protein